MKSPVLPGAEARHHRGGGATGLLVVHGFTGTPASMRPIVDAAIAADIDVEQPLLPGHGTMVTDMIPTRWADWFGAVQDSLRELSARVDHVVVVGQSMGATLVLAVALAEPVDGIVAINPLTIARSAEELELIDSLLASGMEVAPGGGSDICDPDASDVGYDGTPLAPIRSLLVDGVAPIGDRYGELEVPLLLFTSRHDHVVEPSNSEYLAVRYGGPLQHQWLDHSYHVAAIDLDRDLIAAMTVRFAQEVSA